MQALTCGMADASFAIMENAILDSVKEVFFTKISTLDELLIEQLQDLHSAETQLIQALPKMAAAAHSRDLKAGFKKHLAQTKEHVARLEMVLASLDKKAGGKKCAAMAGLIKEGNETIAQNAPPAVKDAALIAAAQRVEHYEIAGYGTVRTYATLLGLTKAASTLGKTLKEEGDTDKLLTASAKKLNVKAMRPSSAKRK